MGVLDRLFGRSGPDLATLPGALGDYARMPLPGKQVGLDDLPMLAIDFETTGLDDRRDYLVSVGFVPVDGGDIVLAGARRFHVRPPVGAGVGVSATIHGLTDDAVSVGIPIGEALDRIYAALTGRVLLAHYARIETGFLGEITRRLHGRAPKFEAVDTLELGRRLQPGSAFDEPKPGALRLWRLREEFGLPKYAAHDALLDAISCAELYLAQRAELAARAAAANARPLTLGDVRA